MIFAAFVWPVVASIWIFVLWMLWIIAKSLKGMDESFKGMDESFREIARSLQNKS